jgi:hypothetical protein
MILFLLRQLPVRTTISKDDFFLLEEAIRSQITGDFSFGRVRRAERMAEVLQILSSIEELYDSTEYVEFR